MRGEPVGADKAKARYLLDLGNEKQKAHYKEIAGQINQENGLLQECVESSWKSVFSIPLVTQENVPSVAITGSCLNLIYQI